MPKPRRLVAVGLLVLLLAPSAAQAGPPVCPDASFTILPGQQFPLPVPTCLDPDGDSYFLAFATPPSHGAITNHFGINYYTPTSLYHGPDEFTYTATDSHAEVSAPATVKLLIDFRPSC